VRSVHRNLCDTVILADTLAKELSDRIGLSVVGIFEDEHFHRLIIVADLVVPPDTAGSAPDIHDNIPGNF
jgi:hypothetical protein